MIEHALKRILKEGRAIEPNSDFRSRSERLITLTPQNKLGLFGTLRYEFAENASLSAALVLASILVAVAVGGFTYFLRGTDQIARNTDLEAETRNIDFQIQLGEIQYLDDSTAEITAYLQEIQNYDF